MKFETAMNTISSQAGRKAVARNALFGAIASLRAQVSRLESMTKSITVLTEKGFHHRADAIRYSDRYLSLDKAVETAAKRAQGIYCIAAASFDIKPEFEPGMPRHLSKEQLAQIAEFSGMPVDKVIELRHKADSKRYASELEAMSMTEAMFWSPDPDEDPEVKAETVLKALQQTMGFIMTWNNPDFAELGILRVDIEIMETIVARESKHEGDRDEPGMERQSTEEVNFSTEDVE
jgi:hypothetical protein